MIALKNTQKKIKVDTAKIKVTAQKILDALNYSDYDLGIWLTTNATIRNYNRDYRNKDKATDILSFPYHILEPGKRIVAETEEDKNVGDIIISLEFVQGVLPLYNVSLQERLDTILIHGICHLLGYSHYDPDNDAIMTKLEKKLAKTLAQ